MTQEEKLLLLKDLSARLPYGVIGHYYLNKSLEWGEPERLINMDLINERFITQENDYAIEEFIVFLRPMSSMTEEEKKEYKSFSHFVKMNNHKADMIEVDLCYELIDWLHTNNFDYRGLIEKGLAINYETLESNG